MMECIDLPSMHRGFPACCRMGAALILLPFSVVFPSSSTFPPLLAVGIMLQHPSQSQTSLDPFPSHVRPIVYKTGF